MSFFPVSILAQTDTELWIKYFRLAGILTVLILGIGGGYIANNKFHVPEKYAKSIMNFVLIGLTCPVVLFIFWDLPLTYEINWLPVIGAILMLAMTVASALIFHFYDLDNRTKITLILGGGLSNSGFTGGAFVCYALFGPEGLGLANVFLILSVPIFYILFMPLLKFFDMKAKKHGNGLNILHFFDARMLVIPTAVIAFALNLGKVPFPKIIDDLYLVDILVFSISALSFLAIGLRLKISRVRHFIRLYFPMAVIKFILTPLLAIAILIILEKAGQDLSPVVQKVAIILSASPSAVMMVTMSNVFDLNGPLASALWIVTMILFVFIVVPVLCLILI